MTTMSATEALARFGEDGVVFVDTRPSSDWCRATIPGACCLNVYDYILPDSSEAGLAGMAAAVQAAYEDQGLAGARLVVFFEEGIGLTAPRGLWFHELCGFGDAVLLNGGLRDWVRAGGGLAPGQGRPGRLVHGDPDEAGAFRRELAASAAEVLMSDPGVHLVDVRRPGEWSGDTVHGCCARAGRIQGARSLPHDRLIENGSFRSPQQIRGISAAAGLLPGDEVILYCHRGARSALVFYALRQAGFGRLSLYAGGWHEWAGNLSLPLVEGRGQDRKARNGERRSG